jgi:hypothetical protein
MKEKTMADKRSDELRIAPLNKSDNPLDYAKVICVTGADVMNSLEQGDKIVVVYKDYSMLEFAIDEDAHATSRAISPFGKR